MDNLGVRPQEIENIEVQPVWSQREIDLLYEFLPVTRLGGRFEGPMEEETWASVAANMNRKGPATGIAQRVYTARNLVWEYVGYLWPLLISRHPNLRNNRVYWSREEEDFLLFFLPTSLPGGLYPGVDNEDPYDNASRDMSFWGPTFGYNWRAYTASKVKGHYQKSIYPRLTGQPWLGRGYTPWTADEVEYLLQITHAHQGGYLEGPVLPTITSCTKKLTIEARIRGWPARKYTRKVVNTRLFIVRRDRIATRQLAGPYVMGKDKVEEYAGEGAKEDQDAGGIDDDEDATDEAEE